MTVEDCYQLGKVIKTHGLKGEVNIHLDVDYPQEYSDLESVFLKQSGSLVPFFVVSIQLNSKGGIVKFEDVDTQEEAKDLIGTELYLPLSFLPELEEDAFYYHDLIDCIVRENGKEIGKVKSTFDLSGNQLLEVLGPENQEILIPMTEDIMKKVDITAKIIDVCLPDGLLDLYN